MRTVLHVPTTLQRLASLPNRRPIASLAVAILASLVVGASGSVFTAMGMESWYPALQQPDVAPPDWVFGPVWTTLFVLMGTAAWLVWRAVGGGRDRAAKLALAVFALQFLVNVAWSAAFFGLQSIEAGLVVVAVLLVAILATMVAFARVDRRAAALLVPYLAWVTFATYLNYQFWVLN